MPAIEYRRRCGRLACKQFFRGGTGRLNQIDIHFQIRITQQCAAALPRPDEFAVARQAPLVIPPDFSLVPPKPGAPRPQEADSSTQALQALFGGPAPRSAVENALTSQPGEVAAPATP